MDRIIVFFICIIVFQWSLVFAYFVIKKRDMDKWKRAYKEVQTTVEKAKAEQEAQRDEQI